MNASLTREQQQWALRQHAVSDAAAQHAEVRAAEQANTPLAIGLRRLQREAEAMQAGESLWGEPFEVTPELHIDEALVGHPEYSDAFYGELRRLERANLRIVGEPVGPPPGGALGALRAATGSAARARAYSTAFETRLSPSSYPGVSRARHFQEANEQLLRSMEASPEFAAQMRNLGVNLERTATGVAPRTPPAGWTWHHEVEPGLMRLVPRIQHTPGSPFWQVLHPGGRGGYSIWGN